MRISDWSSDVCSSDLVGRGEGLGVIMVAEVRLQLVGQEFLDLLGLLARAAERDVLQADVLEAGDLVGELFGQEFRSEERSVGKECVSTCRSRWLPYN